MRKLSLILLTFMLILTSCHDKKTQKTDLTTNNLDSIAQVNRATEFLDLFKTVNPNGLHIYPPTWDKNGKLNKMPFEGVIIDAKKYPYMDDSNIFTTIEACKQGLYNIYAVGKFEISDKFLGLIFRERSQYDESLIQLTIWDKKSRKIVGNLELADSFGDAGWYFDKESWINNYQYNSQLEILSRKKEFVPKENFTSKKDMDSITTDTFKISAFRNSKFITRLISSQDTTKYKLRNWK